MSAPTITQTEYNSLQRAYDAFNKSLFGGTLPQVLITLQRHAHSTGYFSPRRFAGRTGEAYTHELALNPDHFMNCTDKEILDTLVHEMCHVWQETHGETPRRGYHNTRWAAKMEEVGLMPSSTGEPGGRRTGQRMSNYVISGGAFETVCDRLLASGLTINWQDACGGAKDRKRKAASKTKFTCPDCGQNAWAKETASLLCGYCAVNKGAKRLVLMTPNA